MCLRIIERMSPLEPFAWILHLEGDQRGDPPSKNVSRWQSQHGRSVERLTASVEEARTICVESLDYEFSLVGQIIREHDTGVCLDVGHLLQTGREVQPHWDAWADRIGVVHLHGVRPDGTDHVDVSYLPPGFLEAMIGLLKQEPALERVLTLEVFAADDFYTSVEVLKRCLATPTG